MTKIDKRMLPMGQQTKQTVYSSVKIFKMMRGLGTNKESFQAARMYAL